MKNTYTLLFIAISTIVLSSCTTVYFFDLVDGSEEIATKSGYIQYGLGEGNVVTIILGVLLVVGGIILMLFKFSN